MNTYKDKYNKYKTKYLDLKKINGGDGDKVCLFIFISNTYKNTGDKLSGVIEDRKKIIKALKLEVTNDDYKDLKSFEIESNDTTDKKNKLRFISLRDLSKQDLISNIKTINTHYNNNNKNINHIILCINGHGKNSSGLISFVCNDNTDIELYEIIQLFDCNNMTILVDTCRCGEIKSPLASSKMLKFIKNKPVAVMHAVWKGETASDGGDLIRALASVIENDFNLFINSLKIFSNMFLLINKIIQKNVENVTKNYMYVSWLNHTYLGKEIKCDKNTICKKLMSVYFNKEALKYLKQLNRPGSHSGILNKIKSSFKLLCRDFDKGDYSLENSLQRPYASIVR